MSERPQKPSALQRNLLDAERQLLEYRIDLCRALVGGWEMPRPELATLDDDPDGQNGGRPATTRRESTP